MSKKKYNALLKAIESLLLNKDTSVSMDESLRKKLEEAERELKKRKER